jgi:hypothetical protein
VNTNQRRVDCGLTVLDARRVPRTGMRTSIVTVVLVTTVVRNHNSSNQEASAL